VRIRNTGYTERPDLPDCFRKLHPRALEPKSNRGQA
jgi:hypothetical protein